MELVNFQILREKARNKTVRKEILWSVLEHCILPTEAVYAQWRKCGCLQDIGSYSLRGQVDSESPVPENVFLLIFACELNVCFYRIENGIECGQRGDGTTCRSNYLLPTHPSTLIALYGVWNPNFQYRLNQYSSFNPQVTLSINGYQVRWITQLLQQINFR